MRKQGPLSSLLRIGHVGLGAGVQRFARFRSLESKADLRRMADAQPGISAASKQQEEPLLARRC
jgi:hypothetical protein